MEESINIFIGDEFPDLTVKSTKGLLKLPSYFSGKWFVLFSHPAGFTPVCTTEFVSFAKNHDRFKAVNCELVGLSIDQIYSLIKWEEWIEDSLDTKIEFPIISDELGKISRKLGMIHKRKNTNTVRTVFIIDPDSVIRAMLYYPHETGRNIFEILRTVKALQLADKHNIETPANWPNNEIIKDNVIMPPVEDITSAKLNKKNKNSFDWWFCYKKVD